MPEGESSSPAAERRMRERGEAKTAARKAKESREEERKLNLKQKAGRVASAVIIASGAGAVTANVAARAGEDSVKKDLGIEYSGDIEKNVELSLFPDKSYDVEKGDTVIGIYYDLGYDEYGYTLDAFKAEVRKRNPEIFENENSWTINDRDFLKVPEIPE